MTSFTTITSLPGVTLLSGTEVFPADQSGTTVKVSLDQITAFATAGVINAKVYGARGDGVTDDTAALQAGLLAAAGGIFFIPPGNYLVYAAVGACLNWTLPCQIIGAGAFEGGAIIVIKSTVPNTVDGILMVPGSTAYGNYFWSMTGVAIVPESGAPGRYGFSILLPDGIASSFTARFHFSDNRIGGFLRAFSFDRTGALTDTFFTSVIERNYFLGATGADHVVYLNKSGDSLTCRDNTITGAGNGIYTSPVSGVATEVYENNNITTLGGFFYGNLAYQIKFIRNQCELNGTYTGSSSAGIVLVGCAYVDIVGNNINNFNNCSNIRLMSGTSRVSMTENVLNVSTGTKKHLLIDSDCGLGHEFHSSNHPTVDNVDAALLMTNSAVAGTKIFTTLSAVQQFNSTLSASAGLLTSYAAVVDYVINEGMVDYTLSWAITTNGAGTAPLQGTMPFTAASWAGSFPYAASGYDGSGNALGGFVTLATNSLTIKKYDGTYPGGNGTSGAVTGRYPI